MRPRRHRRRHARGRAPEGGALQRLVRSSEYLHGKLLGRRVVRGLRLAQDARDDLSGHRGGLPQDRGEPTRRACVAAGRGAAAGQRYGFFHWYLQFPDVFRVPASDQAAENELTGWNGGFDVVLATRPGSTPSSRRRSASPFHVQTSPMRPTGAIRKRMIDGSGERRPHSSSPPILKRSASMTPPGSLPAAAGCYPLCGRGRVNTYAVFAELNRYCCQGLGVSAASCPPASPPTTPPSTSSTTS